MSRSFLWVVFSFLILATVRCLDVSGDPYFRLPPKPIGDGVDYENIAWNVSMGRGFGFDWQDPDWRAPYAAIDHGELYQVQLARGGGFAATTARPPLYPLLIATVYSVFGRGSASWVIVRLINAISLALAGAISVWLTLAILQKYRASRLGFIVGGVVTLSLALSDRTTSTYSADFLTEPLAMVLMQLFSIALYRMTAGEPRRAWVAIGVLLAAMILARSIMIFLVPGIGLILLCLFRSNTGSNLSGDGRLGPLRGCLSALALTMVLLLPWWMRNCWVLERFLPLGTQGAITLLGGYCDESLARGGDWQPEPELRLRAEYAMKEEFQSLRTDVQREVALSEVAGERVVDWVQTHWMDLPWLGLQRAYNLWSPFHGKSLAWKGLILLGSLLLLVHRRTEAAWLIGLPLLTTIVVMLLYSTGSRFLLPCYGLLYVVSGLGVAGLLDLLISSPRSRCQ